MSRGFELYVKNESIIDWKIKESAGLRSNVSDINYILIYNNIGTTYQLNFTEIKK